MFGLAVDSGFAIGDGINLIFWPLFLENCMKRRNLQPIWGRLPGTPLDPPMLSHEPLNTLSTRGLTTRSPDQPCLVQYSGCWNWHHDRSIHRYVYLKSPQFLSRYRSILWEKDDVEFNNSELCNAMNANVGKLMQLQKKRRDYITKTQKSSRPVLILYLHKAILLSQF